MARARRQATFLRVTPWRKATLQECRMAAFSGWKGLYADCPSGTEFLAIYRIRSSVPPPRRSGLALHLDNFWAYARCCWWRWFCWACRPHVSSAYLSAVTTSVPACWLMELIAPVIHDREQASSPTWWKSKATNPKPHSTSSCPIYVHLALKQHSPSHYCHRMLVITSVSKSGSVWPREPLLVLTPNHYCLRHDGWLRARRHHLFSVTFTMWHSICGRFLAESKLATFVKNGLRNKRNSTAYIFGHTATWPLSVTVTRPWPFRRLEDLTSGTPAPIPNPQPTNWYSSVLLYCWSKIDVKRTETHVILSCSHQLTGFWAFLSTHHCDRQLRLLVTGRYRRTPCARYIHSVHLVQYTRCLWVSPDHIQKINHCPAPISDVTVLPASVCILYGL